MGGGNYTGLVVFFLVLSIVQAQPSPPAEPSGGADFTETIAGHELINNINLAYDIVVSDGNNHTRLIPHQNIQSANITLPDYTPASMAYGPGGHFLYDEEEDACYQIREKPFAVDNYRLTVRNITDICFPGVEGQYYANFLYYPYFNPGTSTPNTQDARKVTEPLYQVNWDTNPGRYCKQACVTVNNDSNPEYDTHVVEVAYNNSINFCCGDDINASSSTPQGPDCGVIQNNIACLGTNLRPSSVAFTLVDKNNQEEVGKIINIDCGNLEVMTDGIGWYRCGNFNTGVSNSAADMNFAPFSNKTVNDGTVQHDIICEQTNNLMYECKNGTDPKLDVGNRVKDVGQSVSNVSQEQDQATTYYCTEQNTWRKDLDDPAYQGTCVEAGFKWTGSMCCSEQEDREEFYNDPIIDISVLQNPGACWNKTFVREGTPPPELSGGDNEELLVINGTFLACDTTEYDYLINQNPSQPQQLVQERSACALEQDLLLQTKFFCNVQTGTWNEVISIPYEQGVPDVSLIDAMHLSDSEPVQPGAGTQACCPEGDCWNGSICAQNQAGDFGIRTYQGLRCENGNWVQAQTKWRWDLTVPGYCPNPDTQCLVNQEVGCIENYEYYCNEGNCDYYCGPEGEWTTRTKYLAQQMKEFAEQQGGSYDLFCDGEIATVTNFLEYELHEVFPSVPEGVYAEDLVGEHCTLGEIADLPCVASMCALKYSGGIAIGITMNVEDIEDLAQSPLRLFGASQSACNGAMSSSETSGTFEQCAQQNIWFNEKIRSIIYSPQGSIPRSTVVQVQDRFQQFFVDMLYNPFMQRLDPPTLQEDFSFMENASILHSLYFAHRPSQDVYAYFEGSRRYSLLYRSHIAIGMPDLPQAEERMCEYLQRRSPGVVCNPPNDYHVIYDDIFIDQFKTDVMAKLRVP